MRSKMFSAVLILMILGGILGSALPAAAQMTVGNIVIAKIDASKFPEMSLQAIIRDGNNEPIPASDLANIELIEEGQTLAPTKYKAEVVTSGVEVMFVLDLGSARLPEMQSVVRAYLEQIQPEDWVGVIAAQTAPAVSYVQPLTLDEQAALKGVNEIKAASGTANLSAGIEQALTELDSAQGHSKTMKQAIIVLSTGLFNGNLSGLAERAVKSGVIVHTVSMHTIPTAQMKSMSAQMNGLDVVYTGAPSLNPIFDALGKQRTQYRFSYRSTSGSAQPRQIELRSKGSGIGQVSVKSTYQVALQAPRVEISAPVQDQEFVRAPQKSDDDLSKVAPTSTAIKARVSWPDNLPRRLRQVQLWIDGAKYGAPVIDILDQNNIIFQWDLSNYRTAGTTLAQIDVQAEDELGLAGNSNPITTKITVKIPAGPGAAAGPVGQIVAALPCSDRSGLAYWFCQFSQWSGMFALGVALIALGLVVVFRGRVSGAVVQMGDAVRQTIARITRPPQTEVGAYLTVLRGAADLPRNRFPLYINTVTPIGRDKRQVELVFDENSERSVVSRLHCEIAENGGRFSIRDLGSNHGTYINGQRLGELSVRQLNHGDQIELGPVERGGVLLGFEVAQENGLPTVPSDLPDRPTEPSIDTPYNPAANPWGDLPDRVTEPSDYQP